MTTAQPVLRLWGKTYPVEIPSWRDPRLLVSAVVLSVLAIGVATLDFRVSIPQILVALLAGALIEGGWTLYREGKLAWPASALNTVAGIALIFRVVGTEPGHLWSWRGWWLFVLVAALALFTKYAIRYRGTHIFNPSNVALVIAFLILGSSRAEPLDFWWAPLSNGWMLAAYAIILAGGLFIAYRLDLLPMPVAFWLTLAAGLGLLAASGHCISARWSLTPVCGSEFWWVVMISPEILFFLFFMITDPKTIPSGRAARVVFAVCIAVLCTVLIAPQSTEFGAKVAVLAGLALMSPLRGALDRYLPTVAGRSRLVEFIGAATVSEGTDIGRSRTFRRGALGGAIAVGLAALIVIAGAPARDPVLAIEEVTSIEYSVSVDPASLPAATVDERVTALSTSIAAPELAVALAEDLAIEAEAMRRREAALLPAGSMGPRLAEMQAKVESSLASGEWPVDTYDFETLHLTVIESGQLVDLAFETEGVVRTFVLDSDGDEIRTESSPFSLVFILARAGDGRWRIVEAQQLERTQ